MRTKETNLIQTLLKEDNNFCVSSKLDPENEISSWLSEEKQDFNLKNYPKSKISVSPTRLPKILEVNERKIRENPSSLSQNLPSLSQNLPVLRQNERLVQSKLSHLYDKISKKIKNCALNGLAQKDEGLDVELGFKACVKGFRDAGHERSRSLQVYSQDKDEVKSKGLGIKKERRGYRQIIVYQKFQNQKLQDMNLILQVKGSPSPTRSSTLNLMPKPRILNSDTMPSVILPQIRSKSSISHFAIFNSGVPTIPRLCY